MTISISNSLSTPPSVASPSPSTKAASEPVHQTSAPADTVKLSQAAQVHLFKQQGMTISQIAKNLSISLATVDGYLGIQVPKVVSTPTQPPTQIPDSSAKTAQIPTATAKD